MVHNLLHRILTNELHLNYNIWIYPYILVQNIDTIYNGYISTVNCTDQTVPLTRY